MMLFLDERIAESIEILRSMEPPDGYYLAFSGGKDSVVLYEIARMSGVKFDAHYNITTADPPEVVRFIRDFYPDVIMDRPEYTMWELIEKNMYPPTRLARYCCKYLKERGGENRVVLVGVKATDSHARRRNSIVRNCPKNGKVIINAILRWNDDEIWEFIRTNKFSYCHLYDEGFVRLGCLGCPMAGPQRQEEHFQRWPKYREAYIRSFERMLENRMARGKKTEWKTGEDVMRWWLQDTPAQDELPEK